MTKACVCSNSKGPFFLGSTTSNRGKTSPCRDKVLLFLSVDVKLLSSVPDNGQSVVQRGCLKGGMFAFKRHVPESLGYYLLLPSPDYTKSEVSDQNIFFLPFNRFFFSFLSFTITKCCHIPLILHAFTHSHSCVCLDSHF